MRQSACSDESALAHPKARVTSSAWCSAATQPAHPRMFGCLKVRQPKCGGGATLHMARVGTGAVRGSAPKPRSLLSLLLAVRSPALAGRMRCVCRFKQLSHRGERCEEANIRQSCGERWASKCAYRVSRAPVRSRGALVQCIMPSWAQERAGERRRAAGWMHRSSMQRQALARCCPRLPYPALRTLRPAPAAVSDRLISQRLLPASPPPPLPVLLCPCRVCPVDRLSRPALP
jgi:hypothetical protein